MKNRKITAIVGAVLLVLGVTLVVLTRSAAIADNAAASAVVPFALSLITALVGLMVCIAAILPAAKPVNTRTLTLAAIFTALCYIGFAYCKIDIPVGTEKTAFHLGNVFCVLAALFIGGFWGGMTGAIGMTLADLTSSYVISAPKTFLLKMCIGLISGWLAHKIFHISRDNEKRKPPIAATIISCSGGMLFNIIADPLLGYFYKTYVLGVPQEVANVWAKMGAVTTAVNAVIAVVVASVFYLALRPALKKAKLLPGV